MNKDMNMDPTEQERDLNQWLESALSQYGKGEPRAGLESRVLANLEAERSRIASRRRWWWAAGTVTVAATAAIALAVWLGHGNRARNPDGVGTMARHDAGGGDRPAVSPEVHPAARQPVEQLAKKALRRPSTMRMARTPEVADAARLEQFPAPTPLSDQEKLLARYVQQFPQRAALMARAQTDLRERNELEMAAPWPKNTDRNGLQQQQ